MFLPKDLKPYGQSIPLTSLICRRPIVISMIQSVQVKDKEEVKVKQEVKQGDKVITEQDTSPLFQWIAVFPPSGYINDKYVRLNGVVISLNRWVALRWRNGESTSESAGAKGRRIDSRHWQIISVFKDLRQVLENIHTTRLKVFRPWDGIPIGEVQSGSFLYIKSMQIRWELKTRLLEGGSDIGWIRRDF